MALSRWPIYTGWNCVLRGQGGALCTVTQTLSLGVRSTEVGAALPSVEAERSLAWALAGMPQVVRKLRLPELPGLLMRAKNLSLPLPTIRRRNWDSSRKIPCGE